VKVVVYPADQHGCGHHRLIWPVDELRRLGHDIILVTPRDRHLRMLVDDNTDTVVDVDLPDGADVVVLQRVTHRYLAQVVSVIRAKGVAVVVDVDDDLSSVHPSNPAWRDLHPNRERFVKTAGGHPHSWHHLAQACRDATLVTATTPALARRYAAHGRCVVLPNYLAEHYYGLPHVDSTTVGWPASLASHPDDPSAVGNALARLVDEGVSFWVASAAAGVARAFGIADDERVGRLDAAVDLLDWPHAISQVGVGIAPLADTKFNQCKSWLKPLELAAVGVPWVASDRVEYRRLHKLGCGLLVDKPKHWYTVLRRLIDDESRRRELSEAGRAVAETLRLRDHAWRWWEAWDGARALEREVQRSTVVVG